jgi:RNA polymerase sigma factor (sigma-70 family)
LEVVNDVEILALLSKPETAERGFRVLVQMHNPRLYSVVYRLMGNHPDTDDALQNTYIKAFCNLTSFENRSSLGTWLHRIAIRESLTLLEKRQRLPVSSDTIEMFEKADSTSFDAEKAVDLLEKAIESLPQKQALVFKLRYFEEMPYAEMSQSLQTSEGALKASFHHALQKVQLFLTQNSHNL